MFSRWVGKSRNLELCLGFKSLVFISLSLTLFHSSFAEPSESEKSLAFEALPHSDGEGLLPKPAPLSIAVSAFRYAVGRMSCESKCVTPFGTFLGSVEGVEAFSNCRSICIRPESSFLNLTDGTISVFKENPKKDNLKFVGVTYQCVEFARKWWMKNKSMTFESIQSAHEIIYLTEGSNIRTKEKIRLARSVNRTAKRPPQKGDLVVYYSDRSKDEWVHGHVAVIVDADISKGIVSLAEENYDNKTWKDPKAYARQISLVESSGLYTLLDVEPGAKRSDSAGSISGWLYPKYEN